MPLFLKNWFNICQILNTQVLLDFNLLLLTMNSFNKVIAPPKTHFTLPLPICRNWNQIEAQELIGSSIMIPGNVPSAAHYSCFPVNNFQHHMDSYRTYLFCNTQYQNPSNRNYNLANLMNMQHNAIRRGDYIAARRFQLLINNL